MTELDSVKFIPIYYERKVIQRNLSVSVHTHVCFYTISVIYFQKLSIMTQVTE